MTFDAWANDFAVRFAGFRTLLENSEPLRGEFQSTFQQFSVEVLQKATSELTLLDPQPFPSEVFAKLYSRCKSLTFAPRSHVKVYDPFDEPRYHCLDCRDGGTLTVYHPIGYSPIRNGCFEMRKHLNTIVVACHCNAGEFFSSYKRYDSKKMKIVTAVKFGDQVDELTGFVLNGYQVNKFSGFEAYS